MASQDAQTAQSATGVALLADRFADDGYVGCLVNAAEADVAAAAVIDGKVPQTFAVLGFGDACAAALRLAEDPRCVALVVFDAPQDAAFDQGAARLAAGGRVPVILHRAGPGPQRVTPEGEPVAHRYPSSSPGFMLEGGSAFDPFPAGIAYSRTLDLLKRRLGPRPDLAGLFREHLRLEFEARDADATMKTMVDEPYVNHMPTMSGGTGHDQLKRFYKYHFIPSTPKDRQTIILNEIVGADAVVLEAINCFTHTEHYDHYLPGVAPTGKKVQVPFVAIAKFRGDKLYYEHIYWDQATVLVQLGLLDPTGLPVCGREQADKARDPTLPSNELMTRWHESEGKPL